jgi:formamidopyrimidine-DNA glycosylase
MPELPDVMVYVEALEKRVAGRVLDRVLVRSPFVVRTFEPPVEAAEGRGVCGVERLGKRVVLALEGGLFVMIHLMIAGRLRWFDGEPAGLGKIGAPAEREPHAQAGADRPAPVLGHRKRVQR